MNQRKVIWNFLDDAFYLHIRNHHFVINGDLVYLSNRRIYALNIKNGHLKWKTQSKLWVGMKGLRLVGDYLINYFDVYGGDSGPSQMIKAINKDTGEIEYSGWTSEYFPIHKDFYCSLLDFEHFTFADSLHNGILYGTTGEKIYAFKFLPAGAGSD